MKTLAKQMIIERAQRLYGRMRHSVEQYKLGGITIELVSEIENEHRNQFKGYLCSMKDLELITPQEYINYFNDYCSDTDKILGEIKIK